MGVHFNGLGNYSYKNSSPVHGWPITISCWFNVEDLTQTHMLVALGIDNGGTNPRFEIYAAGSRTGDPLRLGAKGGSFYRALESTTAYSANIWQHGVISITSRTFYEIWLNGGSYNSATVDADNLIPVESWIGQTAYGTAQCSGKVAEVGIWDAVLTGTEVALLAAGHSPLFIRPQSLKTYMPLIGGDAVTNYANGSKQAPFAVTGTASVADHPNIIYPRWSVLSPKKFAITPVSEDVRFAVVKNPRTSMPLGDVPPDWSKTWQS